MSLDARKPSLGESRDLWWASPRCSILARG